MPCVRTASSLRREVVCEGSLCKRSSGLPVRWQSAHGGWRRRQAVREGSLVLAAMVASERRLHVVVVLLGQVWQGSGRQGSFVFRGRMNFPRPNPTLEQTNNGGAD